MEHVISWLSDWQTLVGAFLGPFLAIILSGIAFWLKDKYQLRQKRKNNISDAEISLTRTISGMFLTKERLSDFVSRLRIFASEIRTETNPNAYELGRINFPAMTDVFWDNKLPSLRFGSFYVHNKILILDQCIRDTNISIAGLRQDYSELLRSNETVGIKNQPPIQRDSYAGNLNDFSNAVERLAKSFDVGIKVLFQTKVYNLKLMKNYNFTRKEEKKHKEELDSLDQLDKPINLEVEKMIQETKERVNNNLHQNHGTPR
jgi:hypothetical protein